VREQCIGAVQAATADLAREQETVKALTATAAALQLRVEQLEASAAAADERTAEAVRAARAAVAGELQGALTESEAARTALTARVAELEHVR
jgi:hypothetical protein